MKSLLKNSLAILNGKEKRRLLRLVAFSIVISMVDIVSLALLIFIAAFYTGRGLKGSLPALPAWLFDKGSVNLLLCFSVFFVLKSIAGYLALQAQFRFVYKTAARISETNLLRYLEGSYRDYVNIDSAVHIRKIGQQSVEFCHYVLAGLQQIVTQAALMALTVIAILSFNARLFLLLLIILLPAVILLSFLLKRKLRSVRTHIKHTGERALQFLKEALDGFVESNIYERKEFFAGRYVRHQGMLNKSLSDLQVVQGLPSRLMEVFAVLGLFVLIAASRFTAHAGFSSVATLGAFLAAAYKLIPGMVKILNISGQIKAYEFTVHELLKGASLKGVPGHLSAKRIRSARFHKVSFANKEEALLNDLSLHLRHGDLAAITGPSGRGKTTVINLLLGFLDPGGGDILLNNQVTDAAMRRNYWRHIAYVKQQPFLINDTVLKNVVLDEGHYDGERLAKALEASGLETWLKKFPEGIGKMITEHGKNISGGERQRIALARALYKEADLLLLDEPFNELDEASEENLLHHLKQLSRQGKMILLITHRERSLGACNKIISLECGETVKHW